MIERISTLSENEISSSANMLARAFWNDPLFKYALPDETSRQKKLTALFILNLRYGLKYGEVYTLQNYGMAIWFKPGKTHIALLRALKAGMWLAPFKIGLKAVQRLGWLNNLSENLHNKYACDVHWYLFMLGVDPGRQGSGLGGKLIEPILIEADLSHLPCYLDTYNSSAVPFYQKHGFRIISELLTGISGMNLWAMRRN